MALGYTLRASVSNNGTNETLATSSFTPANNSLLVAISSGLIPNGQSADSTISGGSLTWTRRQRVMYDSTWQSVVEFWTAPVTTGASMTVTVDYNQNTSDAGGGHQLSVVEFTGHHTTTPSRQVFADGAASGGRSGAYSGTLSSAPLSGSYVITATANDTDGMDVGHLAPGTGWTEIAEVDTGNVAFEAQYRTASTSTTVAMDTFSTSGAYSWAIGGVEIAEAASGAVSVDVTTNVATASVGDVTVTVPAGVDVSVTLTNSGLDITASTNGDEVLVLTPVKSSVPIHPAAFLPFLVR